MKVGYQGSFLVADSEFDTNQSLLSYRFQNHIPNQFTYRLPNFQTADRTKVTAFFAQDTWTHNRLTVQGALRFDHASSFSPAEHNGTSLTSPFNTQAVVLDRTDGVSAYNDLSPRFGIASANAILGTQRAAQSTWWWRVWRGEKPKMFHLIWSGPELRIYERSKL